MWSSVSCGIGMHQLADVSADAAGRRGRRGYRARRAPKDLVGLLREQADQQVGDPLSGPSVELAEHAVVERGDHAAGQDAQVSRVRVGVKETELEDLLEQDLRPGHGDIGGIEAQSADSSQVVDRAHLR